MTSISATTQNAVMAGLTVFVGAGAFGNVLSESLLQYGAALSFGAVCGVTYSRKLKDMYGSDVSSSFVFTISALMATLVVTVLTAGTRCRSEIQMTTSLFALAVVTMASIVHIVVYQAIRLYLGQFISDMVSKAASFALSAPSTARNWAAELLNDIPRMSLPSILAILRGQSDGSESGISRTTLAGIVSAIISLAFGYFTFSSIGSCNQPLTLSLTTCNPATRAAGLVTVITGAIAFMTLMFGELIQLPSTLFSAWELPEIAQIDLSELRDSVMGSLGKAGENLGKAGRVALKGSKALLDSIGKGIHMIGEKIPTSQKTLTFLLFTGGIITAITDSMVKDQKAKQGLFYTSVTLIVLGVLSVLYMVKENFEIFKTLKEHVQQIDVGSAWESVTTKLGKLKDIRICNSNYDQVLEQLHTIEEKIDTIQTNLLGHGRPASPGNVPGTQNR